MALTHRVDNPLRVPVEWAPTGRYCTDQDFFDAGLVAQLAEAMGSGGWAGPPLLVVKSCARTPGGNPRLLAAARADLAHVPCVAVGALFEAHGLMLTTRSFLDDASAL